MTNQIPTGGTQQSLVAAVPDNATAAQIQSAINAKAVDGWQFKEIVKVGTNSFAIFLKNYGE